MNRKRVFILVIVTVCTAGIGVLWLNKRKKSAKSIRTEKKPKEDEGIEKDKTPKMDKNENKLQMVKLNKKAQKRNQRFAVFNIFYQNAKEIFEPFKVKGEREKYFEALYQLAICPGGRWGGRESRVVEIFWGNRMFDKNQGISADGKLEVRFESETGATMFFFKNDNGYVSVQLSPAFTKQMHLMEDFIFWRKSVAPSHLLKKGFQKRCWRVFMAYMEVTSLDGDPSLFQRIHIWYLHHFKSVVVEKRETPVKFQNFLKKVSMWVLTVGFSGLVIFLLQLWLSPNSAEHENVKAIQQSVQHTESTVKQIQSDLDVIKRNQDSMILYQRKQKLIDSLNKKDKQ